MLPQSWVLMDSASHVKSLVWNALFSVLLTWYQ